MNRNNLNRVKGILSARQGTQVPKLTPGGSVQVTKVSYSDALKKFLINDQYEVDEATANYLFHKLDTAQTAAYLSHSDSIDYPVYEIPVTDEKTSSNSGNPPVTATTNTTDEDILKGEKVTQYTVNGVAVSKEEFDAAQVQANNRLADFKNRTGLGDKINYTKQVINTAGDGQGTTPDNKEEILPAGTTNQGSPTVDVEPEKKIDPRIIRGRQLIQNRRAGVVPTYLQADPIPEYLKAQNYTPQNDLNGNNPNITIIGGINTDPNGAVKDAAEIQNQINNAVQLQEVQVAANNLQEKRQVASLNIDSSGMQQPITKPQIDTPQPTKRDIRQHNRTLQKEQRQFEREYNNTGKDFDLSQVGQGLSQGIQVIGGAMGAQQTASDSNTTKNITAAWDGAASIANSFGPVGQAVGAIMGIAKGAGDIIQGITGGTDQMTKTDQWMSSPLLSWNVGIINDFAAKKSNDFSVDANIMANVGSSYGGTAADLSEAADSAGKKYGLFSSKARRKANAAIEMAKSKQNLMGGIADDASDRRFMAQSMGEQAGLAYSMMTDGGYNQKYTYAAKHGGLLEWNPVVELEWQPQVELNWELPTFKDGGSVEFVEELEWIPEFKSGGKTEESDVPEIEETTQKNVIPEGALHKNKHHMEHAEGLTKKGIPVVDEEGEQQAEIEHSEIIFTLEVTKKLEEYYEIFYSEDSTNKEKEQAALDAGKLLVYQILENTEDRTGLIESCKKGGSLTLKKSTDDLIEEVLEWMPTVVIVETEEPKKEESKVPKKDTKDEIKDMIKEVLIELLVK